MNQMHVNNDVPPFTTNPKNYGTIFEIVDQMIKSGLPSKFVDRVQNHAKEFEGTSNLMVLWQQETEQEEKTAIVGDLQEAVNDTVPK